MGRNVALLVLDCVRKDFFDRYAPRLADLADVRFEQARAASSWSPPSHASMFTGLLPSAVGIHTYQRDMSVVADQPSIFSDLEDYQHLGVNANPAIGSSFGLADLFDEYREPIVLIGGNRYPEGLDVNEFRSQRGADGDSSVGDYVAFLGACLRHEHPVRSLVNGVSGFVDEKITSGRPIPKLFDDGAKPTVRTCKRLVSDAEENFFLFANFLDAHHHYQHVRGFDRDLHDVPNTWRSTLADEHAILFQRSTAGYEDYAENRRQLYGAAVDYLDRVVTPFVEWLLEATEDETTVVITADHGDNLGYEADEELVHHKSSLSEGLMHVPLAVVNPPPGYDERVSDYVSHLRLRELLAGLANGETPDVTDDRITAERPGTWRRERFMDRASAAGFEADEADWLWVDRAIRCVYEGERKWEWDSLGEHVVWELDADRPCWQREVRRGEDVTLPDWADAHFGVPIDEFKASLMDLEEEETDEVTRQQLEALGYI